MPERDTESSVSLTLNTTGDVSPKGLECLRSLLQAGTIESSHYLARTGSTNTRALDHLRALDKKQPRVPMLYLADEQTAGRGRRGKSWISETGNLTFSLIVPFDHSHANKVGPFSIAIGAAVCQAIENVCDGCRFATKWPNDILVGGQKLAGILLERAVNQPDQMVVGVGINVSSSPSLGDGEQTKVSQPIQETASLSQVLGRQVDRFTVLAAVVTRIVDVSNIWTPKVSEADSGSESLTKLLSFFECRCALRGKQVQFIRDGKTESGLCLGISDAGSLVVQLPNETIELFSGEVHQVRDLAASQVNLRTD